MLWIKKNTIDNVTIKKKERKKLFVSTDTM